MGRLYRGHASLTISASGLLASIDTPTNVACKLIEVAVTQSSKDDPEQSIVQLIRYVTTKASGGNTINMRQLERSDSSSGLTVKSEPGGTPLGPHILDSEAFNTSVGYFYKPLPGHEITLKGQDQVCIGLGVSPSVQLSIEVSFLVEEIG